MTKDFGDLGIEKQSPYSLLGTIKILKFHKINVFDHSKVSGSRTIQTAEI